MKHLLPAVEKYYKANLHTHSNISDGVMSPEEVKAAYKAKGYSILALTDHEICFSHPELNDEDFLTLTSYELMTYDANPRMNSKTYHLNMIAKEPNNRWQFHHPNLRPYIAKVADQLIYDEPMVRTYDLNEINEIIAKANKKGFLVTYNHPVWSLQNGEDYLALKGLWAVEVYNNGCYLSGFDEDMNQVYQSLLCKRNHLFPVAADDAHRIREVGGGWVMVGARELTYPAVIEALEKGDFYASIGPEIHSLCVEGTTLKITCSPAANINLVSHGRFAKRVFATDGEPLTEAEFDLSFWLDHITEDWQEDAFFRICVTDATGKKAWTRAYWPKDIVD